MTGGAQKSAKPAPERVARYRRGRASEYLAIWLLRAKGYRIIARRVRSPVGEIDLIAVRRRRLAIVEVKRRPTLEQAACSITPTQQQRIMRASEFWLKRNPAYAGHDLGFDVVLLAPRRWRWFL